MGKQLGLLALLAIAGCSNDYSFAPPATSITTGITTGTTTGITTDIFPSGLTTDEITRLKTLKGGKKYTLRRELPSKGMVVPPYHELEYSPENGLLVRDVVPFVTFGSGVLYIDKDADGRVDLKSERSWHSMLPSKIADDDFQELRGSECDSKKAKYEWGTPEFHQCAKLEDFQKAQIFYETAARWFLQNHQRL